MATFEYRQAEEIRDALPGTGNGRMLDCTLLRRCIKDPFPGISHWAGMLFSIAGLTALMVLSAGEAWRVVGCAIYGGTLIVLYAASALAHTIRCSPRASDRLTRFDYVAIFL